MSHRRAPLSPAVVLVLAACAGVPHGAHAAGPLVASAQVRGGEDGDAEALIARGIELREQGKDDEALAVFKRALAKSPSPRARAQVALAEQALGLWVAAEADLLLALSAVDDPWIVKNRDALGGALAAERRRLGSLEVRGTEGAEVVLDGVRLGVLPATIPFRIEAGRRTLEVRAKGFHATTRSIEVPAGGVSRETVTLVALTPDTVSSGGAPGATDERASSDPGRGQRLVGWVFAGSGVGIALAGGVALLVRKGVVDDYNTQCPGLGVGQSADCDGKVESARTWLTVSLIALVGGGLFAVGGATLVATAPRRGASAAGRVRVGCAPSGTGGAAALTCSGSF